jgi:hypothetical protein
MAAVTPTPTPILAASLSPLEDGSVGEVVAAGAVAEVVEVEEGLSAELKVEGEVVEGVVAGVVDVESCEG